MENVVFNDSDSHIQIASPLIGKSPPKTKKLSLICKDFYDLQNIETLTTMIRKAR